MTNDDFCERLSSRQYGTMVYLQRVGEVSLSQLGTLHQGTVRSLIQRRYVNYKTATDKVVLNADGQRAIEVYRLPRPSLRKTPGDITMGVQNLLMLVRIKAVAAAIRSYKTQKTMTA